MTTFGVALLLFLAGLSVCTGDTAMPSCGVDCRNRFPADFIFGVGSAAYQYEGAATKDGRGPSIWDIFVQRYRANISASIKHPTETYHGEIALDFYHRYKDDIKLMKTMGIKSFRFSISWSRIFPNGNVHRGVNPIGVQFYSNLINELKANGIEPFVTLLHFDPPQALEDEYGGFRSPMIVGDFRDYVDFCFKTFGDRVKYWTTLNEPGGFADHGYHGGKAAPGRCSNKTGRICPVGDSSIEPYLVAHYMLLSHAAAVKLYRHKYKAKQDGQIGITVVSRWYVPKYDTPESYEAAERAFDFSFGWFANPITYGEYPEVMRKLVGNRLPSFTVEESKMIKGSYDFLGVNYYTALYAENDPPAEGSKPDYQTDMQVKTSGEKHGVPIGKRTDMGWLKIYPQGFSEYLHHIKNKYNDPIIYVTENGMADKALTVENGVKDNLRIEYLSSHLESLSKAMMEGVKVKSYFVWTLLDDFEYLAGYSPRFGLFYTDYQNNLARHPKDSSIWYKNFISKYFSVMPIEDETTKKRFVCAEHDAIIPENNFLGGNSVCQFYHAT